MAMTTCEASQLQLPQPSWGRPCSRGGTVRQVSIVQHGQGIVVLKELGASHDSQPLQWDLSHLVVSDEHVTLHLLDVLGGDRVGQGLDRPGLWNTTIPQGFLGVTQCLGTVGKAPIP